MRSMIGLFDDGQGNIAMGLSKLENLLIVGSFIGRLRFSKRSKFNDHREMARVSLP